jgi:DNA (cytosine-5)-methyltransferase 1
MKQTNKIKILDLFSGIGGFRLATEKAAKKLGVDYACVGHSEIDRNAIKTYKANFLVSPEEKEIGNICKLGLESNIKKQLSNFNILFAGFPCQPFSMMGSKGGFTDERGTLFFQIEKIIKAKQPELFILENVRGLRTHNNGETFNKIMHVLSKKLKYHVRVEIFNSEDFGVPQTRRRIYFIGCKDKKLFEEIDKLKLVNKKSNKYPTTWHLLDKKVEDKYYLSDKLLKTILSHGSGNYYSKSEINRIVARPLTASMHKMHRANQDNYYSDAFINGTYNKKTSSVIPTKIKKDERVRKITPKEAFRMQGFPDSFVKKAQKDNVSDTQLYRQAGNAITAKVAEAILEEIFTKTSFLKTIN